MSIQKKEVFRTFIHRLCMTPRWVFFFCIVMLNNIPVLAENELEKTMPVVEPTTVEVSLITILPGKSLYSSFGHTALRVVDRDKKTDLLYNYGQSVHPFDISFLMNLAFGRMDFMLGVSQTKEAMLFYKSVENRKVIEQQIYLDQERASVLKDRLEYDSRPENRQYNYRFFTDNCTTRVWLLIKDIIIRDDLILPSTSRSLRKPIEQVLERKPFLLLFISTVLGPLADQPRDLKASLFLPHELMDQMGLFLTHGISGCEISTEGMKPFFEAVQGEPKISAVTPMGLMLFLSILSGLLALSVPNTRIFALVFDTVLFGATFLVGVCIALLWGVAGYMEVGMNTNLLWATPVPLIGLLWNRLNSRRLVSTLLFSLESLGAIAVTIFGGFGIQTVSTEIRFLCAIIFVRCVSRAYHNYFNSIIKTGYGIGAGK